LLCAPCVDSYNPGGRLTCALCHVSCPVHHGTNTNGGTPCTPTSQAICAVCGPGTDNDGTSLLCTPPSLDGVNGGAIGGGIAGGATVMAVVGFLCVRRRRQKRASLAQASERLTPENELATTAIVVDTTAAVVPLAFATPDSPQPSVTLHPAIPESEPNVQTNSGVDV